MHFTPTSASWLNMVERFFRDITTERLRRGVFTSVPELVAAINEYVAHHNKEPKPFIWTKRDEANVVCRGDIVVEPPTQAFVELLGSLDVGHGKDVDLELHVDSRQAGVRLQPAACCGLPIRPPRRSFEEHRRGPVH
jgi:hypothetical protein